MRVKKASTKEKSFKLLSLLLSLCMIVGLLPSAIFATGADTDYLMIATDRHANTSIIGNIINNMESVIGEDKLEYLGLGGDMVGSGNDHPEYDSSTVLGEVTGATSSLSAKNVDIVAGIHDMNVTDDADIVLPYQGGGAQIYEGDKYYIYGVEEYCISEDSNESNWSSEAQKFVTWANGDDIDKSKVIVMVSHYPLHAKRDDNDGAYYWHQAMNTVATGSASGDGSVERNIVFFHGHNHTVDSNEYVYNVGDTMSIQNNSSTTSDTIYYTYATAGYLNQNKKATLMAITDETITLTKYTASGSGTAMTSVTRVVTEEAVTEQTFVFDWVDVTATATDATVEVADVANVTDYLVDGYYYAFDVDLTGQVEGTDVTVMLYLPDVITTSNLGVYYIDDEGNYTAITNYTTATTEDGVEYVVIENAELGIYAYGTPNTDDEIPEGAVLDSLTLSGPAKTAYFLATDTINGNVYLDITGLVVKANYVLDGETYTKTVDWNKFDSNTDGYALTFGDLTTYGEKVVTVSYGDKTAEFTVWVCAEAVSDEDTKVSVTFDTECVVSAEVKETSVSGKIAVYVDNYVAYDITPTYAADYTSLQGKATVTLPIPEGVTNPVVYYVSDDGKTVTKMDAEDNGDGTVSFETEHFSIYVVGNTAEDEEKDLTLGSDEAKTVYVLVSTPTAGNQYIIASSGSAGSAYALKENTTTGSSVTINAASGNITAPYIETTDESIMWNATSGMKFRSENGNYYLRQSQSDGSRSLSFDTSKSTDWTVATNTLNYKGQQNTYYVSGGSTWSLSKSSANVYFYEKQTLLVDSSTKYTVSASDIEHVYSYTTDSEGNVTTTVDLSVGEALTYELQANGETATFEGEVWTVAVVSDPNGILDTTNSTNETLYFTGKTGTAYVRVYYELDGDGDGAVGGENDYKVWTTIEVNASEPYYTIDLHKANVTYTAVAGDAEFDSTASYFVQNEDGTYSKAEITTFEDGVTYYTLSYTLGDEITETISIKGIEAGDKYGVWAVVTYYDGTTESGTDMGAVGDDIEWSSSDETIATVDPTTGVITFTGKEGTVNITATYQGGNKPSDTITISVTQSMYSVPADGTSDFPEYPNEGAIRFDKTATAVGNFSETGIAQIELSMTGVPYTTGSEIDVVVMLDMTGSMTDDSMAAAEAAALAFAKQIILKEDGTYNNNRISVQVFNKNGVTELWGMSAVTAETYSSLVSAIESASTKQASGGTPYSTALSGCKDILDAARTDGTGNDRQQFCVFVSDGTPTSYTDVDGGSDTTKKEYYSSQMQEDGVTVYGVYTSAAAGSSGSSGSGGSVNDTEEGTAIMQNVASADDKVYVVEDYTDTTALTGVFTDIATDILQAATDVTVEDQIAANYTMIFDIPKGNKDITGVTNDFYIEFVKYTLDSNHERTDDGTSVTKLYLGVSNGSYYAASDASGTAYAAPVFEQKVIGEKGTQYYWTTDSSKSTSGISTTVSGTTYYFVPYGMKATDEGFDSTKWFNMTSGGYASGTVDSNTNMSNNLVIATPYFVYNAATKMLYWTVDKIDTTEYALRYFLYLDNSATEIGTSKEVASGPYETNDHAYITYTNFNGNDCRQEFPKPQLTWNGAQVSYVFYLVNEAGQPINKSGQIVDFANATFVTDVFTYDVVWNGTDAVEELNVEYLADELLPNDYMIYDEKAEYTIHVYQDHTGATVFDYFIIEGSVEGTKNAVNGNTVNSDDTTKVYNTKAGTKYSEYGIYSAEAVGKEFTTTDANGNTVTITTTKQASLDYSDTTVAFAVLWKPALVPDVVVVDYGLDVLIDVVNNDFLQNTVSGIGLGNDVFTNNNIVMNSGVYNVNEKAGKLGTADLTLSDGSTISIENENQIRFHQNDMTFAEPVTFYYESPVAFYEGGNQKTGYMYSSVTVIPATTVYYEDSFVKFTNSSNATAEAGTWKSVGVAEDATQEQDRPGESQISAALDADNNYGYDGAYTNMSTYSLGSAKMVTVASGVSGMASFDFYGTGFDVISMTDTTTGLIIVNVYDAAGNTVKSFTVDNYYGYSYQNGEWVAVSKNDPNALYQVPVMKIDGLPYADDDGNPIKYTAKIVANYQSLFDHTDAGSYKFYLDAIRIYDPTGNQNDTANDAYKKDKEGWPEYKELRNLVISKATFDSLNSDSISGIVFIDGATTDPDKEVSIADYTSYGPNNELYLAYGEAVAADLTATAKAGKVESVQLAIKTVGGSGKIEVYGMNGATKTTAFTQTVSTATDMYYDITALNGMTLVIKNAGTSSDDAIISITNIKVTYSEAQPETTESDGTATASVEDEEYGIAAASLDEEIDTNEVPLLSVSNETATVALMSLRTVSVEEDTEVEETPDEDVPEAEDPKPGKPEKPEKEEPVKPEKPDKDNKPNKSEKPDNPNKGPQNNSGNNKNSGKNNNRNDNRSNGRHF